MKFITFNNQLFKSVITSACLQVVNVLAILAMGVLVARKLGPLAYGEYTYMISLATLISIPLSAGMPGLVVRYGSEYSELKQYEKLKGLLLTSNYFVLIYTLFISAILYGVSQFYFETWFLMIILLVPFMSYVKLAAAYLRSQHYIISGQITLILPPLLMAIVFSTLTAVNVVETIQSFVFSLAVASLLSLIFLYNKLKGKIKNLRKQFAAKEWCYSLIPLTLYSGLSVLDGQIGIVLLNAIQKADVGYLKVAVSSAAFVTFGLTAVNMVIAPKISALYAQNKFSELQKLITKCAQFSLIIGVLISVVFFLFSEKIIIFVFGYEYYGAVMPFKILVFGSLVNASLGSVVLILNMTGNEKDVVKGVLLAVISNFVISIILIPTMGAVGASVGGAVSLLVWNSYLSLRVNKKTGLVSHAFHSGDFSGAK